MRPWLNLWLNLAYGRRDEIGEQQWRKVHHDYCRNAVKLQNFFTFSSLYLCVFARCRFLAAYTPLTVYILINCPFDDIFRCTNDILSSDFNNRVIIVARLGLGRFYRDFDSSTHIRHVRTSWNVLRRV